MSREKIVRTVAGRLSLREPQTVSLERLRTALESVPALRTSSDLIDCAPGFSWTPTRSELSIASRQKAEAKEPGASEMF